MLESDARKPAATKTSVLSVIGGTSSKGNHFPNKGKSGNIIHFFVGRWNGEDIKSFVMVSLDFTLPYFLFSLKAYVWP